MPILTAQEEGIEMMYRVQQRSPGSPLAEKALLRTADYYYADQQFDLAADTYAAYVRDYPRSPILDRVKLRQAFSNLAQFRGTRFDATPLIDARAELLEVTASYPQLAQEENLAAIIDRIDRTFAQKLYVTADFYRRTHYPRGAVYQYRYLERAYPQTPEAELARAELTKMPADALVDPAPAPGTGYAPATQPTIPEAQ
jgi:outer membrane protein assembly factor BamD (BamD/ComL family)